MNNYGLCMVDNSLCTMDKFSAPLFDHHISNILCFPNEDDGMVFDLELDY